MGEIIDNNVKREAKSVKKVFYEPEILFKAFGTGVVTASVTIGDESDFTPWIISRGLCNEDKKTNRRG